MTEDLDKPIITALEPDSISCPQPSVTLSAAVDAQGNPFTITWATNSAGSLDSDTNTLNPTVSGAAPYTLSVQNDLNGCISYVKPTALSEKFQSADISELKGDSAAHVKVSAYNSVSSVVEI